MFAHEKSCYYVSQFSRIHRYRLHVNERPDTGLVWRGLNIWRWLNFKVLLKTINSINVVAMNNQTTVECNSMFRHLEILVDREEKQSLRRSGCYAVGDI